MRMNMRYIVVVALWVAALVPADAQGCTSSAPGTGWVCVNGGWLPPGHPGIPVGAPGGTPTPPPMGPSVPMAFVPLTWGPGFPMGEIVDFAPPLKLTPTGFAGLVVNGQYLPGNQRLVVSGAGKVFRPIPTPGYTGPLVIIESIGSMSVPLINSTAQFVVEDLTIQGTNPSQPCIQVQAHSVQLVRPVAVDCAGVVFARAVDVEIVGGLFARGTRCLHFRGQGPNGLDGPNSITHTRIASTRCEVTTGPEAALVNHGLGIVFDRVVFQGNAGAALRVQPAADWPGARIEGVVIRDTWFEQNGEGLVGSHAGTVQIEGVTTSW